jgi:hypothetical protein
MRRPWSVPVALGLLLLASTAAAQTQLPPAPGAPGSIGDWLASDGDPRSVGYLNQLFGPLFAFDGGATETVFSRVIGIFNLVVLGVGGLIFTYNIVVGVLQTAHEGQVLGRRWSSLWAPLRIVFASALLIPLPNGGGYNSLQYVIGYLVKGSTSAANAIWGEVTDSILVQSVPVAGATPPHFAALIQQLWDMEGLPRRGPPAVPRRRPVGRQRAGGADRRRQPGGDASPAGQPAARRRHAGLFRRRDGGDPLRRPAGRRPCRRRSAGARGRCRRCRPRSSRPSAINPPWAAAIPARPGTR